MAEITYISYTGEETTVTVSTGMTVMHGALLNNIEGMLAECGGAMLCATCHCYITSDWQDKLPPASQMEKERLKKVHELKPNSRLGCQIPITDALDGLVVELPKSQVWSH